MSKQYYFTKKEQDSVKPKSTVNSLFEQSSALTDIQITCIRKKTPESEIEYKDDNGLKYKSVRGSYVKKSLNLVFGWDWDFQVISNEYISSCKEVIVLGRLTIRSGQNTIVKEQFGKFNINTEIKTSGNSSTRTPSNIGNAYKAAATDALKKCASELGFFWDIYSQVIEEPVKEDLIEEESFSDRKETEKLEHFLKKQTTIEGIEKVVKDFENTTGEELSEIRKNLVYKYKLRIR